MKIIPDLGIQIPQMYLPKPGTDLAKWAVIACDQFTSQPEYWNEVEKTVGEAPSTLNLTFPEVYLESSGGQERIRNIQATIRNYMEAGILQPHDGLVYVERTVGGRTRRGIVLALDLEAYDYNRGSSSLIRATEGTIVDRLPPRIKIREGALLELPHILVLIDDPDRTVIEPVSAAKSRLEKLYDFELMLESGHLAGYTVHQKREDQVVEALRGLAKPETFAAKYGIDPGQPVLLFAMGDGNHSLLDLERIREQEAELMRDRVERLGPYRGHVVVGSLPYGEERVETAVRVDIERGSVYNRFLWGPRDGLVGLQAGPEPPGARYVPVSERELVAFRLGGGRPERRVSFEGESGAAVLVIPGQNGPVRLPRAT